jgi:hypothetical protein
MKNSTRFYSAIIVTIIAVALVVYYLIPGINHPRIMGGPTTSPAIGMAVICFIIAAIAAIIAVTVRQPDPE